jgi:hypothetical protein
MKRFQLTDEDKPELLEVYNAILDVLQKLPNRLVENQKFALLVVNAMFNLICTIAVNTDTDKQEILRGLEQVYDGTKGGRQGVLN